MTQRVVYASAARTADPTPVDIAVGRAKALRLVIDATAITATPSVVFNVIVVDSLSGKEITLLASAAVTAVSTVVLNIGVGLPVTANLSANAPLGTTIRIKPVHADADSITYSVAAHLIR